MVDQAQSLAAILLLGSLLTLGARGDVEYEICSIQVAEQDADNLAVTLTCQNEGKDEQIFDGPAPLNVKMEFPGTPITLFASDDVIVEISNNKKTFELRDSTFSALPEGLSRATAPLTIRDGRVNLTDCVFKENTHATAGGIHLVGEAETTVEGLTMPTEGPAVGIVGTIFEGGSARANALMIDSFPYLVMDKCNFLPNNEDYSYFIEHKGTGTIVVMDSEFKGPEDQDIEKATALYGSGSGNVVVEHCKFSRMVGSAVDWESSPDDKARLSIKDSEFADSYGIDGSVFLLKSPLELSIHNSKFSGNKATNQGGVFHITVKDPADRLKMDIVDTEFAGNEAKKGGSVLFLSSDGNDPMGFTAHISLHDCHVHDNLVTTPIYMAGGGFVNLTVAGGMYANNYDKYFGGVFGLAEMATVKMLGATFKSNKVTSRRTERSKTPSGGALHLSDIEDFQMKNCHFEDNELISEEDGTGGGTIYLVNSETPLRPVEKRRMTVESTHFIGSTAGSAGGTLYVDNVDHVILAGSLFKGSASSSQPGGAVLAKSLKIFESITTEYQDCKAPNNGGALSLLDCQEVSIVDSIFKGNSIQGAGRTLIENAAPNSEELGVGAGVYMECGARVCKLGIDGSNFESNKAPARGPALLASGLAACNISNTNMKDGSVSGDGGLAWIDTKALRVVDGSFSSGKSAKGGAIFIESAEAIEVSGAKFESNKASTSGGALFVSDVPAAEVIIDGGIFSSCSSDGPGGAISLSSVDTVAVNGSEFSDNAGKAGGALHLVNATSFTLEDSKFSENSASVGGAVFAQEVETATLSGVAFVKNKGATSGNGFSAISVDKVTLTKVKAEENFGDGNGGCVDVSQGTSLLVNECSFNKNTGKEGGALHVDEVSNTKISNSIFSENRVDDAGGALCLHGIEEIQVQKSNFTGNSAKADGGAVRVEEGNGTITITESKFSGNEASSGGAVSTGAVVDGQLTKTVERLSCDASLFEQNTATKDGGSINVLGGSKLEVTGGKFFACIAKSGRGGCINAANNVVQSEMNSDGLVVQVAASNFQDAKTKSNGGSLAIASADEVHLGATNISDSSAGNLGGGVFVTDVGYVSLADVVVQTSEAKSGGALAVKNSGDVALSGVRFFDDSASGRGGALALDKILGEVSIDGGTFVGGDAGSDGGAIYASDSALSLTKSSFVNNTAKYGGAVGLQGEAAFEFDDVDFVGNEAKKGSIMYSDSCNVTVTAEGHCALEVPFVQGFGGMKNEDEALSKAIDVGAGCGTNNSALESMSVCALEYEVIQRAGTFIIFVYLLLALALCALFLMFTLIAAVPIAGSSKTVKPSTEPLMDSAV